MCTLSLAICQELQNRIDNKKKILDKKIKKYQTILDTLIENKNAMNPGDDYPYEIDIKNTKGIIKDLKEIHKELMEARARIVVPTNIFPLTLCEN